MTDTLSRLTQLREALAQAGADGFILPVADEHLGEYVPPSAERLAWLTGFSGSAGLAIVLKDRAALFVDGRYTLQARQETPEYEQYNIGETKPEQWLAGVLPPGSTVAYDPWLHSMRDVERIEKALATRGIAFAGIAPNPVDALWKDRPPRPSGHAFPLSVDYAGEELTDKCARVGNAVREAGAEVCILAASDSVNWLLNIRGSDLAFSPVALAYALAGADGHVLLYIDERKVTAELREHLGEEVTLRSPSRLAADLRELPGNVLVDPAFTPAWFARELGAGGVTMLAGDDPVQKRKTIKNETEQAGIRSAHVRDGVAVTRFLHWLENELKMDSVTEMEAAAELLAFRRQAKEFVSPSFATIAGSGPNGAIVHYRATEKSDRALRQGELFLLDSGGQYRDGTTDITRTLAIGAPSIEQKERFTRVLKGHIALATTLFPEGTSGSQLDVIARHALWQAGLDYDHGTGHGVGHFLNVHEGPQRISKRGGDVALMAGMVLSNEPGYYREGRYGIRIENLVLVVNKGRMESGKEQLGFETLTCAPIDTRLIIPEMLTDDELAWLNAYHHWVQETLSPLLPGEAGEWLEDACAALA